MVRIFRKIPSLEHETHVRKHTALDCWPTAANITRFVANIPGVPDVTLNENPSSAKPDIAESYFVLHVKCS
jgi:hypothetical protein